jgi:hypothetical protein
VHVVSWRAWGLRLRGTHDKLAFTPATVLPSPSVHRVGVPIYDFRSSIPSPPMPLFTLRPVPRGTARKTRGQVGSLLLSCGTLSFPTTCRFIPALGRSRPSLSLSLLSSGATNKLPNIPCGWGGSASVIPPGTPGYQVAYGTSGAVRGLAVGMPGMSFSYGYGFCH